MMMMVLDEYYWNYCLRCYPRCFAVVSCDSDCDSESPLMLMLAMRLCSHYQMYWFDFEMCAKEVIDDCDRFVKIFEMDVI